MLVLGISGGLDLESEPRRAFSNTFLHDSAAVLLRDGTVLAGIEEERLNRHKHTDCFPMRAIGFCLRQAGVTLADVGAVAYYEEPEFIDSVSYRGLVRARRAGEESGCRARILQNLRSGFNVDVGPKLRFVPHHLAHAASAHFLSGYSASLTVVIDGQGGSDSVTAYDARGAELTPFRRYPVESSLGLFYWLVIAKLGFNLFDEYKVMGLAPYGDPAVYRSIFRECYSLAPGGHYTLDMGRAEAAVERIGATRLRDAPITVMHMNVAAALQEVIESVALHILRHLRIETGHPNLCLAGGVAHNCTMNGRIMYSGIFDSVFIQPAAHDGGAALGAALAMAPPDFSGAFPPPRQQSVYWGPAIGDAVELESSLRKWEGVVEVHRLAHPAATAARLLAEGEVLGWVQGRSEFGPRALGNRSIIADPRPAGHKDLINRMIKKREAFRPFAPAILEEYLQEYYEVPPGVSSLPFMVNVLMTRPERRRALGAVTHVDGTARVQTVSRTTNPLFWQVIDEFRRITGVPVLLNTSFNNNAEPIVETVEDALTCLLTTQLNGLIVGDFLVIRRASAATALEQLKLSLPPYTRITCAASEQPDATRWSSALEHTRDDRLNRPISAHLHRLLLLESEHTSLGSRAKALSMSQEEWANLQNEITDLWARRLVRLTPT